MKTNHQRGFVAGGNGKHKRILRVLSGHGLGDVSLLADMRVSAKYNGPIHDRGNRRNIAGAKKFVRSRFRFHEDAATQRLAKEIENVDR